MKEDFRHFFEDKNRLIDRLNLTDEQKTEIKDFFKSHPNYENKIDWNRKDLAYSDFEEVLKLEGNSKSSQKKYGLSGKAQIGDLVEGTDYDIIHEEPNFCIYYPLTFKGSETLAKPSTPPEGVTGKWCIAGKNYSPGTRDQHWNSYTRERHIDFFFIFMEHKKYAVARYKDNHIDIFDQDDHKVDDIWDYSDKYSKMHLNMDWLQSFMEKQPHKIISSGKTPAPFEFPGLTITQSLLTRVAQEIEVLNIPDIVDTVTVQACAAWQPRALRVINIPSSVKTVGSGAFIYNETRAINIRTKGISELNWGNEPFYKCQGKLNIILENNEETQVSSIGDGLFLGADISSLTITYPGNRDTEFNLGDAAFNECKLLKEVSLCEGIYTIGTECFSLCTSLEKINIPKSVTSIGKLAFSDCQDLREVKFNDTVTDLEDIKAFAFARCMALESLWIPAGTKTIWEGAFHNCPNLRKLYLPASLRELGLPMPVEDPESETANDPTLFENIYPENLKIMYAGTRDEWEKLILPFKKKRLEEYNYLKSHTTCTGLSQRQGTVR